MTEEFKPCPRCGNTEDIISEVQWSEDGERRIGHWFICECGLSIWGETEAQAELLWNTRPIEDALRKRVKDLDALINIIRTT